MADWMMGLSSMPPILNGNVAAGREQKALKKVNTSLLGRWEAWLGFLLAGMRGMACSEIYLYHSSQSVFY